MVSGIKPNGCITKETSEVILFSAIALLISTGLLNELLSRREKYFVSIWLFLMFFSRKFQYRPRLPVSSDGIALINSTSLFLSNVPSWPMKVCWLERTGEIAVPCVRSSSSSSPTLTPASSIAGRST